MFGRAYNWLLSLFFRVNDEGNAEFRPWANWAILIWVFVWLAWTFVTCGRIGK